MPKIAFLGAGGRAFPKNVIGDCLLTPSLKDAHIALHDIDEDSLREAEVMINNLSRHLGAGAKVTAHLDRKEALQGADYVINATNPGGVEAQIVDLEVPLKYGLKQTIGDTIGIGGIFKGLRTAPVVIEFARDMEEVCPDAWLLNYTNPMAIVTAAVLKETGIKAVGLCHSVQVCVARLFRDLGMSDEGVRWQIAGINHQAWLLEVSRDGQDLYPEIKRRALERATPHDDMVRYEIMRQFGYYVTESSQHTAEYLPYFIKHRNPELIDRFNLSRWVRPPRLQAEERVRHWEHAKQSLLANVDVNHERSREYAAGILDAMETDRPYRIAGNVLNKSLITNLPDEACVEVPCMVDRNGVTPCHVGELPPQLAALNRTNINPQLLTVEAVRTQKRDYIYQAAMLDPRTAAELTIDEIRNLCDDLIEAHGDLLPRYR